MNVAEAIKAHRAAVFTDEASYTEDCKPISNELVAQTDEAEKEATRALIAARCLSLADVQAKVSYFLEPAIRNREANANRLCGDEGEAWDTDKGPPATRLFLQSLLLPAMTAPAVSDDPAFLVVKRHLDMDARYNARPQLCTESEFLASWDDVLNFQGGCTTREGALAALRYAIWEMKDSLDSEGAMQMVRVALEWFELDQKFGGTDAG